MNLFNSERNSGKTKKAIEVANNENARVVVKNKVRAETIKHLCKLPPLTYRDLERPQDRRDKIVIDDIEEFISFAAGGRNITLGCGSFEIVKDDYVGKLNVPHKIEFKASTEQIAELAWTAIKASKHVGLSYMHARSPSGLSVSMLIRDIEERNGFYGDYIEGRMVKMVIQRIQVIDGIKDLWVIHNTSVNEEYQSWGSKFESYEKLLDHINIRGYKRLPLE